jgi:hypothetical protein
MATKKEMEGARIRAKLLQGYTRRADALAYCIGNRHKKPLNHYRLAPVGLSECLSIY